MNYFFVSVLESNWYEHGDKVIFHIIEDWVIKQTWKKHQMEDAGYIAEWFY